ncbi:unnamed protein product [Penicillium roqueforti FM164]|uniref:Uncharacterized protein n=1 Tax=Penicillium roqueforti (strain FM164) TaxID=1365484 RepID=W6QMP9_PENRF|nr:unnamed protein product [Penicillium roqueforti FM164]
MSLFFASQTRINGHNTYPRKGDPSSPLYIQCGIV